MIKRIQQIALPFARLWMCLLLLLADLSGLAGALAITSLMMGGHSFTGYVQLQSLLIFALFVFIYYTFGLYPAVGLSPAEELRQLFRSTTLGFLIIAFLGFWQPETEGFSREMVLSGWLLSLVTVQGARWLIRIIATKLRVWGEPVVIIGHGEIAGKLIEYLRNRNRLGLVPLILINTADAEDQSFTSKIDQIRLREIPSRDYFLKQGFRTIVIVVEGELDVQIKDFINGRYFDFSRHIVIPRLNGFASFGIYPLDFEGILGIEIRQNLNSWFFQNIKRVLDLTLVFLFGFIAVPLGLLLSIMIRLDSSGKIFYQHKRIGENGQMFTLWKFRTMFTNADEILEEYFEQNPRAQIEWQQTQKIRSDPRITRVGRLLRRTSLDEMPQFWNILKGEMSFVGPRPIVESELARYGGFASLYFRVLPGLTGLWQVSGRNNTTYTERVQFDEYYVNNWSIWLDIYILLRTILVVLRADGAY